MAKRKSPSDNLSMVLFNQVDGICPLCDNPIMYKKNGKNFRNFEIAHIYPLNPSVKEENTLEKVERLSIDVDHEDNLIVLCGGCHTKFDKPRTVEGYEEILKIKKRHIKHSSDSNILHEFGLKNEIKSVLEALSQSEEEILVKITYDPQTIDGKLNDTITNLTKKKIKKNVSDYYGFIKERFKSLDVANPGISLQIQSQVKSFYLEHANNISQKLIFDSVVNWIKIKSKSDSNEAPEIVASFFVQNCEVF